jgi:general secretion pathway protein D
MRQSWVHRAGNVLSALGLSATLIAPGVVFAQPTVQGAGSVSQPTARAASASGRIAKQADDAVTLAFREVEISEVISAFSASMGIPFLLDARVKGKMTLETPEPVYLEQAYELLVAALSLQGFVVVSADGYAKVVPTAEAKAQLPAIDSDEIAGGMATRVFQLENEDATQLLAAIRALVPATNPMTAHPSSNSLIVTDTRENLRRITEIIRSLDRPNRNALRSVSIQHGFATDIAQTVDQLINRGSSERGGKLPDHLQVVMLPDPRTNRILFQSNDLRRLAQAVDLAQDLDSPLATPGNVHVLYLKNAEAAVLAQTLQNLYRSNALQAAPGSGSAGSNRPQSVSSGTGQSSTASNLTQGQAKASSGSGSVPAAAFIGPSDAGVVIQAEPNLNALLVVAPEPLFREIRGVVEKLDVRRAQVFIESLIVEVSADRAAEFGVQFQYLNSPSVGDTQGFGGTNFGARGGGSNLLDLTTSPLSASQGLNVGVIRGTVSIAGQTITNIGLLARALETQGAGNIIATPNLLTLDNEEAKIVIGQNVPFLTGSYTTSGNTSGNPFQTIERRDVGTTLRVRPMVSEGGTVRLQIFQEVSSVVSQRLDEGIVTNKRSIESTVLVEDGEYVVLGGLIQDEEGPGESRVPVLGEIPLLGGLFRYETRERKKTNLFVFLRPVVVRSASDSSLLTMGKYEVLKAGQKGQPRPSGNVFLPDLGRPDIPELKGSIRPARATQSPTAPPSP